MMRGVSTWAVAVRKPTPEELAGGEIDPTKGSHGEIEVISEPLVSMVKRHRVLRLPVIRGVVALVESLKIGFKALGISANAQIPPTTTARSRRSAAAPGPARWPSRCSSRSGSSSCCRPG